MAGVLPLHINKGVNGENKNLLLSKAEK